MKTKRKALLTLMCAVLLVVASVMGTMAYLTSQDTVVNTFTVGDVEITLDEKNVDQDQNPDGSIPERDQENDYHFVPGNIYEKDPTIHIAEDSEDAYIVAKVIVNTDLKDTKLWQDNGASGYVGMWGFVTGGVADNQPAGTDADLGSISYKSGDTDKTIKGKTLISKVTDEKYGDVYIVQEYAEEKTTFTYYFAKEQEASTDIVLFEKIVIDGTWTNDQLKALVDADGQFVMDVKAYAIQKSGFDNVFEAWDAYEEQNP